MATDTLVHPPQSAYAIARHQFDLAADLLEERPDHPHAEPATSALKRMRPTMVMPATRALVSTS